MKFIVRIDDNEKEKAFSELFPFFIRKVITSKVSSKNEVTDEEVSTDSVDEVIFIYQTDDENEIRNILNALREYKLNEKTTVITILDDPMYPSIPLTVNGFVAPFSQAALATSKIKDLKLIQKYIDQLNKKYFA